MDSLINRLNTEDNSEKTYVIGVDGLGGSGKSTLVNTLETLLQNENYACYTIHIDDFIVPRHIRYDISKEEWDCYYNVQWRYDYLVEEILSPIKNGQIIAKVIERYTRDQDEYFSENIHIPFNSVLILEGIFLQRKELRDYLDFIIYLDVPKEIRLQRVLSRDGYIGGIDDIKSKYEKRYFPAEEKYLLEYSPNETADLVIKNY